MIKESGFFSCPKCGYDITSKYLRVLEGYTSRYVKLTSITSYPEGNDFDVECICPRCNTEFSFSDGDY